MKIAWSDYTSEFNPKEIELMKYATKKEDIGIADLRENMKA